MEYTVLLKCYVYVKMRVIRFLAGRRRTKINTRGKDVWLV